MENLLSGLNQNQREAVEYCDGPQLVIAGAGSGKTRVLTYKIAYLLERGLMPWNILALTFTNKAANEMKQRIGQLVGQDRAARLQMGTFHSVFARILRVEAGQIGFNSNFTIYDEADSRSLLKSIISEMNLDDKQYKPASVHHSISMAKNHLISAVEYANDYEVQRRDHDAKVPETGRIFVEYEQRCRQANAMDFDDLLVMTFRLFHNRQDVCARYQERFQYVLVDEYQDTNYAQQQIVSQLTREHRRICVVGDDAQSIYAFRGANID
ncbi:MAG: UvrD-helicase domain-containing protein, partial [Prevotella sp.]|nr:UvrD-helicase domain-containing protein [Prevotella sp.]